jgi:hypothetical protein
LQLNGARGLETSLKNGCLSRFNRGRIDPGYYFSSSDQISGMQLNATKLASNRGRQNEMIVHSGLAFFVEGFLERPPVDCCRFD